MNSINITEEVYNMIKKSRINDLEQLIVDKKVDSPLLEVLCLVLFFVAVHVLVLNALQKLGSLFASANLTFSGQMQEI